MTISDEELLLAAKDVRLRAHAPYSGYYVGVAVLDENGRMHTGCNVENASFPEGICGEANALGSMVAAGGKRIVRIMIVGGRDELEACTPCGGCRQRIREFSDAGTTIILTGDDGGLCEYTMDELLPRSFSAF